MLQGGALDRRHEAAGAWGAAEADEAEDCRGEDGPCTEMCGPVSVVRTARLGRDFEDEKCANRFGR